MSAVMISPIYTGRNDMPTFVCVIRCPLQIVAHFLVPIAAFYGRSALSNDKPPEVHDVLHKQVKKKIKKTI